MIRRRVDVREAGAEGGSVVESGAEGVVDEGVGCGEECDGGLAGTDDALDRLVRLEVGNEI